MTDREKVLRGLECCIDPLKARCPECPYYPCYDEDTTSEKLLADALVLLKGQKPVKVVRRIEETEWNVCINCGGHIISKWKWCPYCGRKVKWDAPTD